MIATAIAVAICTTLGLIPRKISTRMYSGSAVV
jgi:hypothetical protein